MIGKRGLKRGQINLSFGMIFSVILIVIFLAFAFYAISVFMGMQRTAEVNVFIDRLNSDVDSMWKGSGGSQDREYRVPGRVDKVCFIDNSEGAQARGEENRHLFDELRFRVLDNNNMVFYPVGSVKPESVKIRNIDLDKIVSSENPFCIENEGGRIRLTLVKEFGEAEVRIKRIE